MTEFICSILIFLNIWNSCEIDKKASLEKNAMEQKVALEKEQKKLELEKFAKEKQLADLEKKRLAKIEEDKKIAELKRIEEEKKNLHIKTPDYVKSLYFTAYAIWNKARYNNLLNIAKNTWVNSVTIDIKTVTGYTSFDFDHSKFWKIKPTSDWRITKIKEKIKELHKKWIYVVWRIVVFKDNLLTRKRTDLAYKWTYNKNLVWNDYSGNKYLDASSKEVWDYNAELASQAYEMWFDEINFDYVRFPSDWKISKIYAPFSKDILAKNWRLWKIKVLDNFSTYFTKKLRDKHPDIILSADVFGLVTRWDMNWIGQNLESFLLNFDFVWPMTYPSHYWAGTLGFRNPDNHPYEIIKMSIKESNIQINRLNKEIELAKKENRKIKLNNGLQVSIDTKNVKVISNKKIRLWLQGFTCTRCKWATAYNSYKFKWQTKAISDMWLKSYWVWNSGSRYYQSRYK